MALGIMTWTIPGTGPSEEYEKKAREHWIPTVLKQPGVKEFRGYRNPVGDRTKVMVETEFDSLADANQWLNSTDYARIKAELAQLGATDIEEATWDASPILPEALHPTKT